MDSQEMGRTIVGQGLAEVSTTMSRLATSLAHAREKPGHSLLRHKVRSPAASKGRRLNKKSM